jgi:LacI family transcriptional regulator
MLVDHRVDGLIIVPVGPEHTYLAVEQQAGTPVLLVDREPALIAPPGPGRDREGDVTYVI